MNRSCYSKSLPCASNTLGESPRKKQSQLRENPDASEGLRLASNDDWADALQPKGFAEKDDDGDK
jgi:hypothetical protein